jgi:hypothetical protein
LHTPIFRTPRLIWLSLIAFLTIAGCAPTYDLGTPTRAPTRVVRIAGQPTKFARLAPTETPRPSRTPQPTRTPLPTVQDTPAPTSTRTPRQSGAPAREAVTAAGTNSIAPAIAAPTEIPTATVTRVADLNLAVEAPCDSTGGGDYGVLGAGGWEGRDPATHPDLNLAVRGYKPVSALRGLVDYDGLTDDDSPQLWGLFADRRTPEIVQNYQVYDWDWDTNSRGDPIQDFPVTLTGFRVSEGESIYTPDFGHEIGEGYVALVLYADTHRVTLKYTAEDNVIQGYTIHLEGLCVFANLLNLYNARQAAGRSALPALRPGQPIGYVPGTELGVAIRDRGAFLDPRSRKDWWKGR